MGNNAPITLAYDADSLITSAGPVQVTRDTATGQPTQITVPSASTAFGYNPFGELTSLKGSFKTSALLQQTYERDALGRIAQLTETIAGTTTTTEFAYDADGRLTGVSRNGKVRTYSYDPNGNRLSVDNDSATTTATYDAQDRILTYGSRTYTHDLRGNVSQIQDGTANTVLTFDDRDRLAQVNLPNGTTVSYVIDDQGRRIAEKLNNALTAAYLYDGQLRPRAQVDAKGNVISEYAYAEGINVPEAILTGGKTYALLRDHIGSVRLVVDVQTGAVAQRLSYDEFGRIVEDTNPGFQPFGFAGGLYDADTGFVHFGAREYDPYVGRWISKDPIGFDGGQTNFYVYSGNNPVGRFDPSGLLSYDDACKIGNTCTEQCSKLNAWNPLGYINCLMGCVIGGLVWEERQPYGGGDKERCKQTYYEQTAYCGSMWTDDYRYEMCMDNAWANYMRCLNGLPPKGPLVPVPPR